MPARNFAHFGPRCQHIVEPHFIERVTRQNFRARYRTAKRQQAFQDVFVSHERFVFARVLDRNPTRNTFRARRDFDFDNAFFIRQLLHPRIRIARAARANFLYRQIAQLAQIKFKFLHRARLISLRGVLQSSEHLRDCFGLEQFAPINALHHLLQRLTRHGQQLQTALRFGRVPFIQIRADKIKQQPRRDRRRHNRFMRDDLNFTRRDAIQHQFQMRQIKHIAQHIAIGFNQHRKFGRAFYVREQIFGF